MPIITAIEGRAPVSPKLGVMHILHGITPETLNSTHYFGFSTRNFRVDDDTLDAFQLESDCQIRKQDLDAIEAVEKRIDAAAAIHKELLVRSDALAIKVRQKIEPMLDADG
jgi:vanillate O-demethylase monooxygenase subunit